MTRILFLTSLIFCFANSISSVSYSPVSKVFMADDIAGDWVKDDGAFKVRIERIADKYYGKILWLEQPFDKEGKPKKDVFNPDPKLRDNPVIGLTVLKSLKYYRDGLWEDGELYDLESGKSYDCRITLRDKNHAEMRAYITFSFLGKSFFFNRVVN
jgi:uncharacterized protein (DUF2147 family)